MKHSSNSSKNTRIGTAVALAALALGGAYCKGRVLPEGQCTFNSDCDNGEVCAGLYCRKPCNSRPNVAQMERDRDCPAGYTCRPADDMRAYACIPPNVPYRCVYHSECNQAMREVCARDGFCRPQCVADYDCQILTGGRMNVCIREADGGSGTCDFRLVDGGDDASADASSTDAPASDGPTGDR